MSNVPHAVTIGTRGSALARWQTDYIRDRLRAAWPELTVNIQVFTTQGDRMQNTPLPAMGGKGVFTEELETALLDGSIDFAVHSLKDLPTENPPGLIVGATPERGSVRDVLVSRGSYTLATLPPGATVGTCSRRRTAQLLHRRPDVRTADLRGNVDTRIRKAHDPTGIYDAIILAEAGIERLEQTAVISDYLSLDVMLPAPGQGALAVQCRDEADSRVLLAPINHPETEISVTAERVFLAELGGGCALPIAAYGVVREGRLYLRGRVSAPDGSEQIDVALDGAADLDSARQLGNELARIALEKGALRLLGTLE
jgi:hydroxymethylbilane synthase